VLSCGMAGCVVGSSDDESTGGTSGGGSGGSGATGGGSTGGSGGSGATGGSATGGSGGAQFECEPADGGPAGTPGSCKASGTDKCEVCIEAKCCTEWSACAATGPGNPCMWGSPTAGDGEIFCFQTCYTAELKKGTDPTEAKGTCAGSCATPSCGTVSGATSELIACLDKECLADCFQQ